MNERNGFLKALEENEDDLTTRLVYTDWLDDHGEHEEADRQRKWPAAKEWLVRFCEEHNPTLDEADEYGEWVITYKELLELGRGAVEEVDASGYLGFSCGNNMEMSEALNDNGGAFWKNWSIVTGIPLPPDYDERKTGFGCAC